MRCTSLNLVRSPSPPPRRCGETGTVTAPTVPRPTPNLFLHAMADNERFVELFRNVPAASSDAAKQEWARRVMLALKLLGAAEDAFGGDYDSIAVGEELLKAALDALACETSALTNDGGLGPFTAVLVAARRGAKEAAAGDDGDPVERDRKKRRTEDLVLRALEAGVACVGLKPDGPMVYARMGAALWKLKR